MFKIFKKITSFFYRVVMFIVMLLIVMPIALIGDLLRAIGAGIQNFTMQISLFVTEKSIQITKWVNKE